VDLTGVRELNFSAESTSPFKVPLELRVQEYIQAQLRDDVVLRVFERLAESVPMEISLE